jgi:surfeit locus 1 family protein
MRVPPRTLAFLAFAFVLAAGCVRLGFWQLGRLAERRARNAEIAARLAAPPAELGEAMRDSATTRYRRVQLAGRYDFAGEVVLTSRGRDGAPGVHVLTPLQMADGSRVLVNRGWVYAADGMTLDLARWREPDTATVEGYLEEFVPVSGMVSTPSQPRGVRHLVRDSIAGRTGGPVAPFVVVQRLGAGVRDSLAHPVRLELPSLSEGAHGSYAIQWFAFATIALVGGGVVARRRPGGAPSSGSPGVGAR